ncbi:unnamed protein product [Prorocentrum cordatum]|uniref:Uncharacterized protein n=1 Tax=Prorocentrum cordatum TaxID=2364126 RepID=A0ABN9TB70_9DINO|nr:unnamed protein product [Polarella glacialis]
MVQGVRAIFVRKFCANDVPRVVNDALGQLRDKAAPLLQEVAEDLPAPVAPDGSGRRVDLRQGAVGWFGGLLQQGFATGQAAELLDKIAQGIPSEVRELPGGGVQLASMATEHPAELALDVFLQGASLAGLRTLSAAGVEALGPELLSLSMRQAALNVSAEIGFTATAGLASAGAADVSARRLLGVRGEWLFEGRRPLEELRDRFQLHLSLENLSAGARVGLLLDDARVQELTRGQSWYDTKCMRGMVQNASVTGVDVLVTVPRFVWNSKSRSVGALETDLDAAINSVLGYLNVPQMRPTVSRMVQSVAAGKVRDVVNAQLQGILADSDDSECDPKYGFQQMQLFYVLAFAGGVSVLAACAAWLLGKAFVPAGGAGQGTRASCQGAVILLAMASACLQQCGLLALPLRAAMRFRSGDPRDDIFGNVFLMGLADPIGRVDGFLAVALVAVGVSATRALCVALAAATGFSPKASRLALRLAGFGGWGFALTAILATTQVVAFHISILTFGDSSLVLGAMLGGCVYLQLLGLYLCDAASVAVLRQCGADRPLAEDGPAAVVRGEGGLAGQPGSQTAGALAASVAPPLGLMASGLAGVLAVLPFLPWIPLWAQEWGGLVGEVATYQSQEAHRVVSLADVLANQGFLVNPGPLQVGARVMQLFVLLHTLVAPAAHASLAVAVGMQLRGRASAEASSELLSVHLVGGLELMRMWSAADVFAIAVMVSVADLGNELAMMRQQMCSAVEPVLPVTGMTCFEVDCVARPGLAALLVWGLASRLLAELSAHRPLRRLRLRGGGVGAAAGGPAACDAAASAEVELGRSFG